MNYPRVSWRRWLSVGLLVMSLVGAVGLAAQAQERKYKQIDKALVDPRAVKTLRVEVQAILRATNFGPAEQKKLQDYYGMHIIAGMSREEALQNPKQFPDWRKQVVGDLSLMAATPAKHTFVRDLVFTYAKRLVDDKEYSPACRYNAILLIGELNDREMQGSGRSITPAIPHAKARPVLLERFNDPAETEAIRVGALIGLARHNKLTAAAGNTDAELVRTFVGVIQKKQPDANGSLDALQWMQRISSEALGDAGQPGAAKLLEPMVADETLPVSVRCAAAGALGRLAYQATDDLDEATMVKTLGKLAMTALGKQMTDLKTHLDSSGTGGAQFREGSFRPPVGEGGSDEEIPEDPLVRRIRRQLKFELLFVKVGLRGIEPIVVDANAKTAHVAMLAEIDAILKQLDVATIQPQELFDKLGQPFMRLENVVGAAS